MSEKCPLAIGNGGVGFSCAECDATEYSCHPSHHKPKTTKKVCPLSSHRICKEENCMFWNSRYGCVVLEFMLHVIATESARP